LILGFFFFAGNRLCPPAFPADDKPPPEPASSPESLRLGLATWNIEGFDGAGPKDDTPPTRSRRHLEMIARILLDTGAAVIGLQEINSVSEFSDVPPLEQILRALNKAEREGRKKSSPDPVWKGRVGEIEGVQQRVALLWNNETVEALGVKELQELRVGYREMEESPELADLRFPRIPLVGRFRLRRLPDFDFNVIVLHLKAMRAGFDRELDVNDARRLGELEDLLFKWVLNPAAQGEWADRDIIILGDLNESGRNLVRLLDEFGTRPESGGILTLYPDALARGRTGFLLTGAGLRPPGDYTYQGNREKGEIDYRGKIYQEDTVFKQYRNVIDHILISTPLAGKWDGNCRIVYFEEKHGRADHVHLSDHRPVVISLFIPSGNSPPPLPDPERSGTIGETRSSGKP